MKHTVLFLNIVSICLFLNTTSTSLAAAPLRVEGRNCTVADRGSEIWYGFFKGKREVFSPLKGGDLAKTFSKWRCFEAEVECNSWKYWMQTDFPSGGNEAFCRQGG
jgi:hypothetical protein